MRLLFVSGTTIGGSGRSQRELAKQLVAFGHEVVFLVDPESTGTLSRWWYQNLADLAVRLDGHRLAIVVRAIEAVPGRRQRQALIDGLPHIMSPVPENAAPAVIKSFRPDVIVGSSIARLAWRKISRSCRSNKIPSVLYIREQSALNHFAAGARPADVVLANADSFARTIRQLGIECEFIPSVIDTEITATESSRRVALAINPIESHGVDLIWKIADRLTDVPFVLQESWPLTTNQLENVQRQIQGVSNVEFRRAAPPGPSLYGDARVLLVPHLLENRPRVIAEAQANGIPVLACDVPTLAEAVGPGGVLVPAPDVDAWCDALRHLWDDEELYVALASAALTHSERPEISMRSIAQSFERAMTKAVATPDQAPDLPQ